MNWAFVHVPKTAGCSVLYTLGLTPGTHYPASALPGHDFYFAFVRNPYDRIVSAYFYRRRCNERESADFNTPHFREWLMDDRIRADMAVDEVFRPMVHYLDTPVDFVGRFESLQEDFDRVCEIIEVEPRRLIMDNIGTHPPWQELLDEGMLERVHELYREDFESFGYERIAHGN